ncbi:MAG: radical SAM family heme chaperone HemW [Ruminococcaceae bacterium]|nr:radical SAM family heme chaperone HemW [Oscillospiraceae bacterium]
MSSMEKTGLYIHIPFCIRKCAYCDFVSYEGISREKKESYVSALIRDMDQYCGEEIDTVYVGGGTPTTLEPPLIKTLMDAVYDNFKVTDNAEITIECNPKTADYEYFKFLRECGFNRLSIGVQSLNDSELSFLSRVHNSIEAISCINQARLSGFDNVSVDVMFGLPNQKIEDIKNTLDTLTDMSPSHISCYSLIIEPGTPFYERNVEPLDDDKERDMQSFIVEYLREKGFMRYEISNFAKGNMYSKHNLKYWNLTPYIGVGAKASSYYRGMRYEKTDNLDDYIKSPTEKKNLQKVTKDEEMSEFMFLGLRRTDGVSFSEFYRKFGIEIEEKYNIKRNLSLGLLIKEGDRLYLSERGIDVSNSVLCDFV